MKKHTYTHNHYFKKYPIHVLTLLTGVAALPGNGGKLSSR